MRIVLRPSYLVMLHMLVWMCFFVYEQAVVFFTDRTHYDFRLIVPTYLLNVALFYFNGTLLLPRLYGHRHWAWRYLAAVFVLLAGYGLLRCEINFRIVPALGLTTPGSTYSYGPFWVLAVYRGMFFQFASMGYWFARNALAQQQQLRVAEKSLLEAHLAFLKSQINPHFLFNALNFIYAQVYPLSENAAKGIQLLSETMRYALHEDINGKVMLAHEIKHLRNYIALNQLRFNNQLQVQLEIVGDINFLMIMPLLLITFVENCFKHGELADPAHPLIIRLHVVQGQLTFEARNKKRQGPKEMSTGIGLMNTRQRLDLLYPGRYLLRTEDEPDRYTCWLRLNL